MFSMAVKNVENLDGTGIKQWVKNNIRFDARADGNGLYLRFRETRQPPPCFSLDLNSLALKVKLSWEESTPF